MRAITKRLLWLAAIWAASVAALGVVALLLHVTVRTLQQ
jgi:hypothetical protein